jgi:putative ABC transport system substrate-binding protein
MTQTKRALLYSAVAALLCLPLASTAKPVGMHYRIGWLAPGPPLTDGPYYPFLKRTNELGYVEGKNLTIEYRGFRRAEEGEIAARELVRSHVDVIVAQAPAALSAAFGATKTIPIVAFYIADPVRMGVVKSLARPGGNVTGFTWDTGAELAGRRLQLIKEMVPTASRIAILWDRNNDAHPYYLKDFNEKAGGLGLSMLPIGVSRTEELEAAFQKMTTERVSAVVLLSDPFTVRHRDVLTALLKRFPIPALWGSAGWPLAGAVLTYSANHADQPKRAAEYVDKILKGASPADLPFQQPTKFELIVDLKAAKVLGLTPPQSLLIQADRVIQP